MKKFLVLFLSLIMVFCLTACKEESAEIELPQNISLTEEENQPTLKFYDTTTKKITELELEEYLKGVLAGEIYNTWPIEALKAQAILARTFTLNYLQNNKSKYAGADISNDVSEAQAYDATKINENIEKAVAETRGKVVVSDGKLIEAWFHSNSGGMTTTAVTGLNYLGEESFTKMTNSPENEENSDNYSWSATFTKSEILSVLRGMGVEVSTISNFEVGEKDGSGRATTLKMGGAEFSANTFRAKIGSTKMKSTLIEEIVVSSGSVSMTGKGYGHGVGMSQWGAKVLAEEGKTAKEIIEFYFDNIEVVMSDYKTAK